MPHEELQRREVGLMVVMIKKITDESLEDVLGLQLV